MVKKSIGLREFGGVTVVSALVMAYLLISFVDTLGRMSQESCTCGDTCDMVEYETPPIIYAGWLGVFIIFFVGAILLFKGGSIQGTDNKKLWADNLKGLEADEKAVYKLVMDADGTVFQSELVEKTGLSKVKVSRTLDKLESMRLLERRRRGLTNIIVLK